MVNCVSRRRAVKTIAATSGTACMVLGTGCAGLLESPPEKDVAPGVASDREPTYRQWLPAPYTIDRTHEAYVFGYLSASAVREHAQKLPDSQLTAFKNVRGGEDYLGVDWADIDEVIQAPMGYASVVRGRYDPDPVVETLGSSAYDPIETYRGFERYRHPASGAVAAVADDGVVWTSERADPALHRTIIDTQRGDNARLHEAADVFDRLLDYVGRPTRLLGNASQGFGLEDSPAVATVQATRLSSSTTAVSRLFQYLDDAEAQAAGPDPARELLERAPFDFDATATGVDGDVTRADGNVATEEFGPGRDVTPIPTTTWAVERADSGGSIAVEHAAGDEIAADRLSIAWGDDETEVQFGDKFDTVETGDAVTVSASGGERPLRITWESETSSFVRTFDSLG